MYVYIDILTWVYICPEWFICFLKGRGDGKWKSQRPFTIYPFACFEVQTM